MLYPGTKVLAHHLLSSKDLNGEEGVCEMYDTHSGRVHVRFDSGVKALRPSNLIKVRMPTKDELEEEDPQLQRILEIFQKYDTNGDGVIDVKEFLQCLKKLGLGEECLRTFLSSVDKDGDGVVQYEEFCEWTMSSGSKSKKTKLEVYWPDDSKLSRATPVVGEDDEDLEEKDELTVEDVARICGGELPEGWPGHGITVVNNMRNRFPDYPVEGIVWAMRRNNFIGGKVIAVIRATGAREVEAVPASAVKIGMSSFPAMYRVRSSDKPMLVYSQTNQQWSFRNMRDNKMCSVGSLPAGGELKVEEVRRGAEYNFCYGRIRYEEYPGPCWVVLGLEVGKSHWTSADAFRSSADLTYTEAERLV